MTHLTFIRYFVPDSNEFAPGWYQTRNEGRTRIGDVPLSLSDALYDGPNRVIIDDNTPETNTLPVSGGKGVDEFLITRTANSVVIDDDSGANVIVFERDVVITSIERQAGSEGASVAQYVITLSSGKTITLRNPASFTFQHLGDATRTAPISAEDFVTAYEDGFAASDASHPDIIGDASGPSGAQGPIITSDPLTASRNEDQTREETVTGTLSVTGTSDPIVFSSVTNLEDDRTVNGSGVIITTYGRMVFDQATSMWTYSVRVNRIGPIREGETYTDTFTFTAGGSSFDLVLTIIGVDSPTVLSGLGNTYDNDAFTNNSRSSLGDPLEDRAEVVLRSLFTDHDDDLTITFLVYYLTELGSNSLNDVTYKVYDSTDPSQTLEEAIGLTYDPVTTRISGTFKYKGWYRFDVTASDGRGNSPSVKFWRSISQDNFHSPVIGGDNENTVIAGNDLQGSASGSISITDRDQHHPITFPTITLVSGAGTYGTMTFDGKTWTYTVDNDDPDTIGLAGGDEVNETFTFRATGASSPFTVTIRVSKAPPPVINGVDNTPALTAGDDAAATATGMVTVSDKDELDLTQLPGVVLTNEGHDGTNVQNDGTTMSLKGTYGTLTFTPTAGPPPGGTWVYTLDNEDPDTLALGDGATGEDEFILRAEGAEDFVVLVTVTGVDDAPRINIAAENLIVKAGDAIDIDLFDLFRDPEGGALTVTVTGLPAGLEFNQDADLGGTVIARNIVGSLTKGTYTIRVTASDEGGQEGTTSFTINVRDALSIVRYFPASGGNAAGWYRENDGGGRGGAVNVYDTVLNQNIPSRVVIDGNTPPNSQAAASIAFKGGRDSEIVDGANRGLIITAKEIGPDGNNITVEFRLDDLSTFSGVRFTGVLTENNVKKIIITLNGGGATFAEIKKHVEDDPTYTEVRALIDITIADGMDDSRISAAIEETALSDGEGEIASIGFRGARGSRLDIDRDPDLTITAKTAGSAGNSIVVEFKIGSNPGLGVETISGGSGVLRFTLHSEGATLAQIKSKVESIPAVRDLIDITIADGKEDTKINNAIGLVSLSGGASGVKASVGYDSSQDAGFFDLTEDPDLIITARTAGADGNQITVEFETGSDRRPDFLVTNNNIKIVLPAGGMTLRDLKSFIDSDSGADEVRDLISLEITPGREGIVINVDLVATSLSGGSGRTGGRKASIGYNDVQDSEVADVAGDRDLIIAAKTAGENGNGIEVEFEIDGNAVGNGVKSIEVSGRSIKFVLKLGGATLAEIKTFFDDDGSAGAIAARALINIRIADGKDAAEINTAVVATALSGGVAANDAIQENDGNDEFFIKANASSSIIHDPWDKGFIIFDENVIIESIVEIQPNRPGEVVEFPPGQRFPAVQPTSSTDVRDYIVTLSSGNTITIQDVKARTQFSGGERRYSFLHEGDESLSFRSAESFFNAYKDGFYPDLTQTEITGAAVAEVNPNSGYTIAGELTVVDPDVPADQLPEIMFVDSSGRSLTGIYGTLTVSRVQSDLSKFTWNYVQNNNDPETIALRDGEKAAERFTLTAGDSEEFVLEITAIGINDFPIVNLDFDVDLMGTVGEVVSIDLSTIAIDPDGDPLNINVEIFTPSGDPASDLTYNPTDRAITGIPTAVGTYTAHVTVTEGIAILVLKALLIEIEAQPIRGDNTGSVVEDNPASTATGSLTLAGLTITLVDNHNQASNSGVEGTYGTMTFDPSNNTWTYTLDNDAPDTNALKDTPETDEFTFTAIGTSFDVTITVAGANDAPVLSGTSLSGKRGTVGQAIEPITDTELNSLFSDPDTGDVLALAVTLDDGSALSTIGLSYTAGTGITGDLLSSLTAGTYTIKVVARDSDGTGEASPEATFTLGVVAQGISGDNVGSVTEDDGGNNSATGTLSALGQTIGLDGANSLGRANGTYGQMRFDESSGVWTYTLDNSNDETNKLAENATAEDLFTFSAGTSSYTVTITVSGANDAPVVATAIETQSGTEGQSLDIDLANLFSDPDTGDTLRLTFVVMRNNTDVTSTVTHSYTNYILSITPPSEGTYTVIVTASDRPGGSGLTETSTFTLEAEEQLIGGDATGEVTEDDAGNNSATGTLTAGALLIRLIDPNNSDTGNVEGTYGVMTFDGTIWTYTLDNTDVDTQALAAGEEGEDSFSFATGSGRFTVVITVHGENDAPEVSLKEDGTAVSIVPQGEPRVNQDLTPIDLSGLFTDVDGDELTLSFEVRRSGSIDPQELSDIGLTHETTDSTTGAAVSRIIGTPTLSGLYTITVIATDGSMEDDGRGGERPVTARLAFNINIGADLPPIIRVSNSNLTSGAGTVMEDGTFTAEGTIVIIDPDGDPTPTIVLDGANTNTGILDGQYGMMAFVESTGTWTYTLNNNHTMVQGLGDGETLTETFTFTALGAEDFDVEITITGANDAPVLLSNAEPPNETVTKSQNIETGDLRRFFTDQDTSDELTLTVTLDGGAALDTIGLTYDGSSGKITGVPNAIGTFTIKAVASDGTADAADALTFTITVRDQEITGTATGSVTEDDPSSSSVRGTLTASEGLTIVLQGGNGVFLRPDGSGSTQYSSNMRFDASTSEWAYVLGNNREATQKLSAGQTVNEVFTFAAGEATFDVTITITGSNDAPTVVTAIESQSGVEGLEKVIDLSNLFTDIDTNDTLTLSVTAELDGDEITFDGSRNIISDLSASKELRITLARTGTYTVTVKADDGNGGTVSSSFSLDVVADTPPVIGIPGSEDRSGAGAVTEDGPLTDTGVLEVTDIDNPPTLPTIELDGDGVGTYGTMTFDGRSWTYTLDERAEALGDQQTEIETFTFTALGAKNFDVEITVTGVNDVPVVGTAITNKTGTINQPIEKINLGDAFTDADENDTLTLALTVTLDGNAVILTTNGTTIALGTTGLTYNTETHILSGDPSIIGTYKIKIVATDSAGASSAETEFDIVVTPETISGDDRGSVTDGGAPGDDNTGILTAGGSTITLVSKETTDSPGMSTGTYGVMAFNASSGEWTYTLDDRVEVLAEEQTATETFTFSAEGGTFVVTITVTGANDAPTFSGEFINRGGPTGGQFILTNLSDRFTDVDEGDELTFTVTLDDDTPLSTIGLTYDSDDDEITGTLTEVGTYVIKIVATDKSGATVETTFDLNIVLATPEIQRNSLTYNPDETSITIDETMLEVTSGNESDPTLLVYTITTLPDAGMLLKSGTPLNNGDTFTQADINNGLITYEPSVTTPSTSQSNPLSFTFSDGVVDLEEQTLEITSREVFEDADADADEDNLIDLSGEIVPQKIEAGDGSDIITGGRKDDQIDGGAGDDEIKLTRTVNNVEEVDAGADEVLYTFGYDGVGIDGGDEIVGFKRGQDKLTFVVDRNFNSLTEFLQSLNGDDDRDLTADDAFVVTMQWGTDEDGAFYFDSVLLHFKEASAFGSGRVSSPLVQITFDERLGLDDLVKILGGAGNADNFDFTHAAFENLDEVLPRLFGEGSIGFKGPDSSGTNGASERASEEPLEPPIYETPSEQHGDDPQPTSFELSGGETDII